MKLRDQILDALKAVPGKRHFHLHTLLSAPYQHSELYPYASFRPRIYAQYILVLCSEQVTENTTELESVPGASRVFVTAIEATLFYVPITASAILYVAKVDSTGQGKRPAPTSALVRALIAYYANPETRPLKLRSATLWVHLFARAERQYLFPNSADHPSKKPLNDIKLCAWWKRILEHVVQDLKVAGDAAKLYFLLPGMNELEAHQALGELHEATSVNGPKWIYGHPYSQTELSLPYVPDGKAMSVYNLGQLIPSFDDDPKSRFIDEIACTTQIDGLRSPQRKRRRTDSENEDSGEKTEKKTEKRKEKEKENRVLGELGVVSADEFWERMSFRQECVAGAITAFFVLVFPSKSTTAKPAPSSSKDKLSKDPLAPRPGEVSHYLVQRVIKSLMTGHEFSTTERSLRATFILEEAIRGLCSGAHAPETTTTTPHPPPSFLVDSTNSDETPTKNTEGDKVRVEESEPHQSLEPPKTPPPRRSSLPRVADISPNPFPDPEPSEDMYSSFVYGEIAVSNPEAPSTGTTVTQNGGASGASTGEVVTVLTARKKKRT